MKKQYQQPAMKVVKMQHQGFVCTSDPVRSVNGGDTGIGYGGGGSGPVRARARGFSGWDEN